MSLTSSTSPSVTCSTDSLSSEEQRVVPEYSRKVFIGGLPFDVSERDIFGTFSRFGRMHVDWPRRQDNVNGGGNNGSGAVVGGGGDGANSCDRRQSSGYVFLIFRHESHVQDLLNACVVDNDRYFINMNSRNMSRKAVQVRPWRLDDYYYAPNLDAPLNPHNTVFIGGVPRPTRAIDLVEVLQHQYGKVVYASIDIDPELRYPKGAARVVFASRASYVMAMTGRFIHVPHCGSKKRIDIKPYIIDEQMCSVCNGSRCMDRFASYFCAFPTCLKYYCEPCWDMAHYKSSYHEFSGHLPYVRNGDSTRLLDHVPHLVEQARRERSHASRRHEHGRKHSRFFNNNNNRMKIAVSARA